MRRQFGASTTPMSAGSGDGSEAGRSRATRLGASPLTSPSCRSCCAASDYEIGSDQIPCFFLPLGGESEGGWRNRASRKASAEAPTQIARKATEGHSLQGSVLRYYLPRPYRAVLFLSLEKRRLRPPKDAQKLQSCSCASAGTARERHKEPGNELQRPPHPCRCPIALTPPSIASKYRRTRAEQQISELLTPGSSTTPSPMTV